jgi:hypothetical protein
MRWPLVPVQISQRIDQPQQQIEIGKCGCGETGSYLQAHRQSGFFLLWLRSG